jgi:DNA-binding CsgD family transcriptional regulator
MSGQGYYPLQNFAPDEYRGESQNWDISQSSDKKIYIANNKGLLEYNGANWRLYDSPNHTILRSVTVHNERVYTGCYMEFGFWERDEFSNLKYTSLSKKIEDDLLEDEQFWKIVCFDQYVLFQSLHRIYIYNDQTQNFQYVTSIPNLPKVFMVENRVLFQKIDEGLFELENGLSTLISDDPEFKKDIVVNIFALQNKLLIQTQDQGFFILDSSRISKWQTEDSEKINTLSVYCSLQLNDGTFVLGTISEGLYFLSSEGKIMMHIDKKSGLLNNTILSLHEDLDNNIWLGLDNGISVINYNSPYRVYNDTKGVFGAVYTSAFYEGNLYLGTNQGLFYRSINSTEDFKIVEGTKGQVWSLRIIDNTLFCGHNRGTFIIIDSRATLVSDVMGTWDIKPLPQHKNLLLQGNYEGLHVLEKSNGNWQYRNKIEGFNISSRFFEFISGNKVMVSHEYRGVYNLELGPDYRKVNKMEMEKMTALSINSSLTEYNGKLFYFSESGIFEFDPKQNHFIESTLLNQLIVEGEEFISGKLIKDENQYLWAFTKDNIVLLQPGTVDKRPQVLKIPLPLSIRGNIAGYENLIYLGDRNYLLGTANGFIVFNPDKITDPETSIGIHTVEKNKLNQKKVYIAPEAENHLLKATERNLHFSYSVPVYEKFKPVKYQYKLEGIYTNWSDWTKESRVSFTNLPSGDYTFKVRAMVGTKLTQNTAAFDFSIAKAWYVSDWMKTIYFVLLLGVFFSIRFIFTRRYNRQKEKIMLEKKNELAMLQLENEKERIRLRNENLNIEIEAISKELASSYMAIVAKNDLLNAIKNNLNPEKENKSVRAAIKIIDDNLEKNTDWKSFQEAFDNTDRDFLKRIKELHPSITPNDLKLCVYLRLNLSSKEIAPLLNISAQSVEIKRFRLRKKMGLSHGQNLTEYILSL